MPQLYVVNVVTLKHCCHPHVHTPWAPRCVMTWWNPANLTGHPLRTHCHHSDSDFWLCSCHLREPPPLFIHANTRQAGDRYHLAYIYTCLRALPVPSCLSWLPRVWRAVLLNRQHPIILWMAASHLSGYSCNLLVKLCTPCDDPNLHPTQLKG